MARFIDCREIATVPSMMVMPRNFTSSTSTNLAFLAVDLQFEFLLDEFADTAHHPVRRFRRPDEDIAVIGVSAKLKSTSLQFLIQLVEHHVAEQRTQRTTLNRAFFSELHHTVHHHSATQNYPDQTEYPFVGNMAREQIDEAVMVHSVEKLG